MKEIIDITPMSDEERFWALFAESYDIQQAADAKALYALNKQRKKPTNCSRNWLQNQTQKRR